METVREQPEPITMADCEAELASLRQLIEEQDARRMDQLGELRALLEQLDQLTGVTA